MQKNKLAMCKRIFKDFQATKIVDDEKILIIDWKNKDSSGEYAIRYTLDMEKGNFIITGDVGFHDAQDAQEMGLNILDVGHHAECIMKQHVASLLNELMGDIALASELSTEPFKFV